MSIDLYPELDAAERTGTAARGLGAASLFYRNNDDLWKEFRGRDLRTLYPGIRYQNFADDGARIDDVAQFQTRNIVAPPLITTLSVGGNDLLVAYGCCPRAQLKKAVEDIVTRYIKLVDQIRRRSRNGRVILTTVYDPTDGTGDLGGGWTDLPLHFLDRFNDTVRDLGPKLENVAVADVHAHFMGHGVTARGDDRWYWPHSIIEPSAHGASEIRRLWLAACAPL
jgi:hypothetical protein